MIELIRYSALTVTVNKGRKNGSEKERIVEKKVRHRRMLVSF